MQDLKAKGFDGTKGIAVFKYMGIYSRQNKKKIGLQSGTGNTLEGTFQGVAWYNSKIPVHEDFYLLLHTGKLPISITTVNVYTEFFLILP